MDHCDVLIVGGGPAGSSCAWRLAGAGLDVVVLDKAVFPRDKVCAGWITPAVFDELEIDPAEYGQGRVLQPITAFRVGFEDGPTLDIDYPRPVSYGIRRCEFDHYLLARCGARLRQGEAAESLVRTADGWVVNDRYRSPVVIGAGGHFCPVAQSLNAATHSAREPAVLAQESEFLLDERQQRECRVEALRPELYFCRDLAGYGWCFRKGDYLNIGLGREDRRQLSHRVAAFCERLQREGRIPAALPARFRGHAYALYAHSRREVAGDRALLLGDAAGLASTESGEGIRPAIESGLLAADVILGRGPGKQVGRKAEAAAGDGSERFSRERLDRYRILLERRFGRRGGADAERRPSGFRQAIAGWLLAQRWFVRGVVLDRWFLRTGLKPLR